MKFMLSIYGDEARRPSSPEEGAAMMEAYFGFGEKHRDVILAGDGLQPTATATTVRVRDGEQLLTDGPFAETKEQLGGFYVIDVATLDDALAVAAEIPGASTGSVEVRPVMLYDNSDVSSTPAH